MEGSRLLIRRKICKQNCSNNTVADYARFPLARDSYRRNPRPPRRICSTHKWITTLVMPTKSLPSAAAKPPSRITFQGFKPSSRRANQANPSLPPPSKALYSHRGETQGRLDSHRTRVHRMVPLSRRGVDLPGRRIRRGKSNRLCSICHSHNR